MNKQAIEQEAINIIKSEKEKWEEAEVQVTERVRFRIRDLIRTNRKNYYGVFDNPIDHITGRKRLFYPLTEEICDQISPKIGIQTKNIDFTATNEKGYITAEIARLSVRKYLRDNYIGEMQDEDSLTLAIDGTTVRKTWSKGKKVISRNVDLLNVFIDPTAKSIQDAYRFTERGVMFADELKKTGWMNTKDIKASEELPRIDTQVKNTQTEGVPQVDVWEMYGKMPGYLLTGNPKDTEDIDGHIIVSGIEAGTAQVHVLERNTNKDKLGNTIKPYEEGWYIRVPGRWYGKGVAEKLLSLQVWMNMIINIRITRATLSQLGIFKIRRGSNITSSQISKLGVNGAISVGSMDDIEQLIVQEASQASYQDEDNVRNIAQRLTSAFEVVTGENLPASTPATNAALASKSAMGTFTNITNRNAMFIQRWVDRQLLPRLAKNWTTNELVNLMGNDEKFEALIERVAVAQVMKAMTESNKIPTEEALLEAFETTKNSYRKNGNIFITDLKDIVISAIDTRVQVSNEDLDNAVISDKLISVLQLAPEFKGHLIKQLFNVLGLAIPAELYKDLANPGMNKTLVEQEQNQQELEQEQLEQQGLPPVQGAPEQTMNALTGGLANR